MATAIKDKSPTRVQAAYAEVELARLEGLRAIHEAVQGGRSQTSVARDANMSQAEVSRIMKRIALTPEMLNKSPRELILEWAAGKILHQEMMDALAKWSHSFSKDAEPDNPLSVRRSSSWDQVKEAVYRGLLDDEDYQELLSRVLLAAA